MRHLLKWRPELLLLLLLVVISLIGAGLWAFAELADEVMEGDARFFDRVVLLALGAEWIGRRARKV